MKNCKSYTIWTLLVAFVVMCGTISCTGDFEQINKNPYQPDDQEMEGDNFKLGAFFPQMQVNVIEPLGSETQLYLTSKNQHVVAKVAPNYTFKIGESVNFEPVMDKAKFFDKETEKNICEEVKPN